MWLLDSIFFNVIMPKFLLTVSILLDLIKDKNKLTFTYFIFFLSKYCFIIWEQWRRIVRLGTLPSMEVNLLSSTCIRLGVLFHFDAKFLVVSNAGVTFTSTAGSQLWLGDWTTEHGCCWVTFAGGNIIIELFRRLTVY